MKGARVAISITRASLLRVSVSFVQVFGSDVNTYTTSRLRVNYLCIFLVIAVDKLEFYMYVFLIYVCLQKHCLRLICLSSITHTYSINISDVNTIGPSYRVS